MTEASHTATYGGLADRLEKQIGADILPSMWVIPANDVRTIIAALRKSAESEKLEPTRDQIIDDCVAICERLADRARGEPSGWAEKEAYLDGRASAADECAELIRALKNAAPQAVLPPEQKPDKTGRDAGDQREAQPAGAAPSSALSAELEPTPRTDAQHHEHLNWGGESHALVDAEFARQLERELAEANEETKKWITRTHLVEQDRDAADAATREAKKSAASATAEHSTTAEYRDRVIDQCIARVGGSTFGVMASATEVVSAVMALLSSMKGHRMADELAAIAAIHHRSDRSGA